MNDELTLLEAYYAARLKRGDSKEDLKSDLIRQIRAARSIDPRVNAADLAEKILDAAVAKNNKSVV